MLCACVHNVLRFVASELANSVQDAFVIAVEDKARARLQRLSALQRIKPVDMSLLSMQVSCPVRFQPSDQPLTILVCASSLACVQLNNQSKDNNSQLIAGQQQQQPRSSDNSYLHDSSPIYVTSLSGQNVTGCSTQTTDSSVAFKPAPISHPSQLKSTVENAPAVKTTAPGKTPTGTPTPSANSHRPLAAAGSQLSSSSAGSAASKTLINNNHIVSVTKPSTTTSNGSGAHPQTSFDSFFGNSAKSTPVPPPVVVEQSQVTTTHTNIVNVLQSIYLFIDDNRLSYICMI